MQQARRAHAPLLQPGAGGARAVPGRRPLGGVPGVVRRHRTLRGLAPRAAVGGAGGPRLRLTCVRAGASQPAERGLTRDSQDLREGSWKGHRASPVYRG